MLDEALAAIGLTKNETKAYLTLLRVGRATSYTIVQEGGISSGKIYETLDKLIGKGLVSSVIIKGKKHFDATDPERLLDYMKRRELDLMSERAAVERIIPILRSERPSDDSRPRAELYEGFSGIKTVYELLLRESKAGETIHVLGATTLSGMRLDGYLDDFNRRRIAKGVRLRIILTQKGNPREEKLRALRNTEVIVFPAEIVTPSWLIVTEKHVVIFSLLDHPVGFVLKSGRTARSYRAYLDALVHMARATSASRASG